MSKKLIITGGTSGIGEAVVRNLLSDDWDITILARGEQKVKALQQEFSSKPLHYIYCDLTDLASVKRAADQILTSDAAIDVLMNNAGAIFQEKQLSANGIEMTFALNHIGHFLLTTELLDKLIESKSRVINVSSAAHRLGKLNFEDLNWQKTKYSAMTAYGNGKLCNIYFTKELHHRFNSKGITAFSCHPGVVKTNFAGEVSGIFKAVVKIAQPFMISPEKGAETQIYLATKDDLEKYSGRYFDKKKVASVASQAQDQQAAAHLWEISEQLVEEYR